MAGLISVSNGRKFRDLLASQPYVYAPGVGDAYDAGLVARKGFKVVYASGYSIANKQGVADTGMLTQTEMVSTIGKIVGILERGIPVIPNIPVVADADTGYGGPGNVKRTVREYALARVAALHIEDQVLPKKCGQVCRKQVIPIEEAVGKYRAAVAERDITDPYLFLIARSDAIGAVSGSLEEGIRRGRAYADAGADGVWLEFPNNERRIIAAFPEAMQKTHRGVVCCVNYSHNKGWRESGITFEDLANMGYKFIFSTLSTLEPARIAVDGYLEDLLQNGAAAQWRLEEIKKGHPLGSSQQALGLLTHDLNIEELYVPGAAERGEISQGFGSSIDEHALRVHGKLE